MKILFICHRFPYPPNRGGKIRPFNMIRHLSQNHEVTVASLAQTQQEHDEGAPLREHCRQVIAEVEPSLDRWRRAVFALPTSTPSSAAYFSSPRLRQRILDCFRRNSFDLVWVHCAFMGQYAEGLNAPFRILDYGDLDASKWLDYAKFKAPPLAWGYGIEAHKLRKYEKHLATRFNQVTVTAQGEKEEFESFGIPTPCTLIPNGVDFSYFQLLPDRNVKQVIAFLGRMDYFPNVDGVSFFARSVFPFIREKHPAAEFRIVGSNPLPSVKELASIPGISVTGYVPDVRPYVQDAAVSVVPLRIARGTQNKTLECISMGIPVVSSSTAAKGIQARPNEHLLVADTPQQYAQAVSKIFEDPDWAARMAEAGRIHIQKTHNWANSMLILDSVIASAKKETTAVLR
ncbi:MAG TPA: TIGR03087 family PEP-CTERM/XrtA system glycosyltransferase [Terriglobales bacterium]|nr:TIGR03087 family PEP-CTERM/XrtA system glycosyltransferase [Terriglobales bacterium]